MSDTGTLQFAPLPSAPDSTFFAELGRRKLHAYGLSDAPVDICGSFARAERTETQASPMCIGAEAFSDEALGMPPSVCVAPGELRNANTLEEFKEWDKSALLEAAAKRVWEDIQTGAALHEPERLVRFMVITFADLKCAFAQLCRDTVVCMMHVTDHCTSSALRAGPTATTTGSPSLHSR